MSAGEEGSTVCGRESASLPSTKPYSKPYSKQPPKPFAKPSSDERSSA